MKVLSLAILLSACSLQATQAADALCPLYELYPSPPYYVYYCYYFDPAGDCDEGGVDAYDYYYYPVVPYYLCEHCRDPAFTAVEKAAKAEAKPRPPLAKQADGDEPRKIFPGLTEPIDENYQYELPRGPDNTGPEGKPDGIGDARQYGTATDLIKGRTRIVSFKKTADGPDYYAKVFQLTLRLKDRSDDNRKTVPKPPEGDPVQYEPIAVVYFAMELADSGDRYPVNATLRNLRPGDAAEDCHVFVGRCKVDGEDDDAYRPITILTVVDR